MNLLIKLDNIKNYVDLLSFEFVNLQKNRDFIGLDLT
jgi:hypothetical protein